MMRRPNRCWELRTVKAAIPQPTCERDRSIIAGRRAFHTTTSPTHERPPAVFVEIIDAGPGIPEHLLTRSPDHLSQQNHRAPASAYRSVAGLRTRAEQRSWREIIPP